MNTQMYTAASGLVIEERRLEVLANNLANSTTPGFRAQRSFRQVWQRFDPDLDADARRANQAVALAGSYELPGSGPVQPTGRPLDIALGDGEMLSVLTDVGTRYTRNGSLGVSIDGELIDGSGRLLLGEGGQPIDGLAGNARIAGDGRVFEGDNEVGRLKVIRDTEGVLRPTGDSLYDAGGEDQRLQDVDEPNLQSGWLEGSAADPLVEMVHMIESQRAFESYQKLISMTMNEVNQAAIRDITG